MNKFFLHSFILVGLLCIGCASMGRSEVSSPGSDFATAKRLVGDIFSLYSKFALNTFSDSIAQDFSPSRSSFINDAEKGAHAGDVLDMTFSLDQVLRSGEILSIKIKWQKRIRPYGSSEVTLANGRAELVFKEQVEKWQLYQVTGQNPF